MTDVTLYVDLAGLGERDREAFLAEAADAGLAVDELYGTLGVVSEVITVLSTGLSSVIEALSKDGGGAVGEKLASLLGHLFNRKDRDVAIEDRETRITFIWDAQAKGKDRLAATAAMAEVAAALHLITDRSVFRWDPAAQHWYTAPK